MKVNYAIVSSDDNPLYLDFWPVIAKLWQNKLGIQPILLYFGINPPASSIGKVVHMKTIPDVPLYLQCTCSRLWYACQLQDKETAVLSDIDMLPLSKWYFVDQLKFVNDHKYVHLNPCVETYGHLAMCYNVAQGKTFRDVLCIPSDWEAAMKYFMSVTPIKRHTTTHPLWFVDETVLTHKVFGYGDKSRIVMLKRPGGQNGRRIDRPACQFDGTLLKNDYYFDCHSPRPLSQHVQKIKQIAGEL